MPVLFLNFFLLPLYSLFYGSKVGYYMVSTL